MDLPTTLSAALRQLDHPGADPALGSAVDTLTDALALAVASYHGFALTISSHGYPVVLTAARTPSERTPSETGTGPSGGAALTSLRVPLALLGPGFDPAEELFVYATDRRSLVDLAADLAHALTSPADAHTTDTTPARQPRVPTRDATRQVSAAAAPSIVLDADPAPPTEGASVRGLAQLSTINHAEGVMISRGHHPDEVSATLRRQAASCGLSPHTFAAGVLQEVHDGAAGRSPSSASAEPVFAAEEDQLAL